MDRKLSFFVPGLPAPGGSKKAFIPKGWTRAVITDAGGQKNKDWRAAVSLAAYEAIQKESDKSLFEGALFIAMKFVMPRLKNHFNSRGDLKPSAPVFVTTRPDALKLARSTEDAMTGVIYRDDSQIAMECLERIYGNQIGAYIRIETL